MTTRVAIVTGSNKGIGFAIVRALCKQFNGDVFLTSRNEERGQDAVKQLEKEGLHPKYHQLDVCNKTSIGDLKQYLEKNYGGVDVLVNNAGIAFRIDDQTPFAEQAEITMRTNYTARLDVCDAIFPILKAGARVVHMSSSTLVWERASPERIKKIQALKTIEEVTVMMNEFVAAAKVGKHKELGWVNIAYGTAKVGVTAVTPIQQAIFDGDKSRPDIVVNACCPGYVDTDMSCHKGNLSIDEGAETPVYCALLPPNVTSPRGDFVKKKIVYKWREGEFPPQR